MRITNAMMTNTTLININRNMRRLDSIIQSIESTKKIQVPSDDPIIASRALKFRTNVAENEQFQRNVRSGLAWMEVTEASFMDITKNLLTQLKELTVASATGSLEYPDKMANIAAMRELVAQIGLDMNQTYAGRYVFSGFRTDQPPLFVENNNRSFVITQTFDKRDIEKVLSFQKSDITSEAISHSVNVLKLPYNNLDGPPVIPGYTVALKNYNDPDAYLPPVDDGAAPPSTPLPVIHYIPQTGELVMHRDTAVNFADGTTVTYQKTNFLKDELNPMVYFDCREINVNNTGADLSGNIYRVTQQLPPLDVPTPPSTDTISLSALAGSGYTLPPAVPGFIPSVPGFTVIEPPATVPTGADYRYMVWDSAAGTLTYTAAAAARINAGLFSVSYTIEAGAPVTTSPDLPYTDLNFQHVKLQQASLTNPDPHKAYDMKEQNIQYEFATNTYVTINSLAMNVYTDKMFADFKRLFEFADSLQLSDEKSLIENLIAGPPARTLEQATQMANEQLVKEKALMNAVLHDRFNNMLNLLERHSANAMKEHTQMGSRMYRLELLQIRLEEDEASYTKLMSENEDTDMARAIILKAAAEAAYAASLRASANLVQLSLANFIG
jgi:flagellar hook-associated protein 3 FlgL